LKKEKSKENVLDMRDEAHYSRDPVAPFRPKPGDRVIRVTRRLATQRISLPNIHPPKPFIGVSLLSFVYGFAAMIAAGTLLLVLPVSSNEGHFTSLLTSLFTSTSAVCVTGLEVVDTLDHWSLFGQIVIAFLIQFGGLGFMISATLLLLVAGRRIGLRSRILIGESVGIDRIGGAVSLARRILLFTLIAEVLGAVLFFVRFSSQYQWPMSVWKSIFQTISAFNNAGFDIFGGFRSLSGYQSDYLVLLTTAALIIAGGIGFVVFYNIFRSRGLHHSSIDTKVVLLITLILLVLGTVVVFVIEYGNSATLGNMTLPLKILNSFFQSVTSRTAGFNTLNIGSLAVPVLFFVMILMFIGGASGSTAGGIKVNTFGLTMITVWNTIRGREHPQAFGREFSVEQIFRALTLLVLSAGLIGLVFFVLSITDKFPSINLLFETISAFGTVGLTTGITPDLSIAGKIIIILMMFIGRLGPLTLTLALAGTKRRSKFHFPKDNIRIG
jgi:trk system potassium uptake protein TrkH